jgi:hypothetical protein
LKSFGQFSKTERIHFRTHSLTSPPCICCTALPPPSERSRIQMIQNEGPPNFKMCSWEHTKNAQKTCEIPVNHDQHIYHHVISNRCLQCLYTCFMQNSIINSCERAASKVQTCPNFRTQPAAKVDHFTQMRVVKSSVRCTLPPWRTGLWLRHKRYQKFRNKTMPFRSL